MVEQNKDLCKRDIAFFFTHYIKRSSSALNMEPNRSQRLCFEAFCDHRKNIVRKDRQAGVSTAIAAQALWSMLLRGEHVHIIEPNFSMCMNLTRMLEDMFENLPVWMLPHGNTALLRRELQHVVLSATSTEFSNLFMGSVVDRVMFDEAAWITGLRRLVTNIGCSSLAHVSVVSTSSFESEFDDMWAASQTRDELGRPVGGFVPLDLSNPAG